MSATLSETRTIVSNGTTTATVVPIMANATAEALEWFSPTGTTITDTTRTSANAAITGTATASPNSDMRPGSTDAVRIDLFGLAMAGLLTTHFGRPLVPPPFPLALWLLSALLLLSRPTKGPMRAARGSRRLGSPILDAFAGGRFGR